MILKKKNPIFVKADNVEALKEGFLEAIQQQEEYYVVDDRFGDKLIVKISEIVSLRTCVFED